jgi:hypothetical protein
MVHPLGWQYAADAITETDTTEPFALRPRSQHHNIAIFGPATLLLTH